MKNIILNSSHIVSGTFNSEFEYVFPSTTNFKKGDKIALGSISMYYSNFNINGSLYGNNTFSYKWMNGTTYNITIPDGYYNFSDLNNYLHFEMVKNKHYLINATGEYVYFLNITVNQSRYAVQVDSYELNTSIATSNSWLLPSSPGWSIPATSTYTQLIVNSSGFGKVLGYSLGSYPTNQTGYSGTQSFLSSTTPEISPTTSFLMTVSCVNNKISIPNSLLYSFTTRNVGFGELFEVTPSIANFIDCQEGSFNTLRVTFYDQNLRRVRFEDSQTTIMLYLADETDYIK